MAERKRRNVKKQQPKKSFGLRRFFATVQKVLLSVLLVGLISVVGFYTTQKMNEFVNKPFEQVVIKGDLYYTQKESLERIVRNDTSQSFVKEHLEKIRTALVDSPWVDKASLTRRWPNQLEVSIVEQKAIARWGDEGFVNFRGQLVKTSALDKVQHLPLLYGAESDAATIMQQYKKLTTLLINHQLAIHSLNKNALGIWQMQLSNNWTLILGRHGLEEKIQTVSQVLNKQILLIDDEVDTIDMRYENGFAIAWREGVSIVLENDNENQAKTGEPS